MAKNSSLIFQMNKRLAKKKLRENEANQKPFKSLNLIFFMITFNILMGVGSIYIYGHEVNL